jgi:DNA polymerase III delta prime subunit
MLTCYQIFGPVNIPFTIPSYPGERKIESLSLYPLQYAEKSGLVSRQALRERGLKFLTYKEPCHQFYVGRSLSRKPPGDELFQTQDYEGDSKQKSKNGSEDIEAQVVVDFTRVFDFNPDWEPDQYGSIEGDYDFRVCQEPSGEKGDCIDQCVELDDRMSNDWYAKLNQKARTARLQRRDEPDPEDDDLLLLPNCVFAFVLRTRKWLALEVDKLLPVKEQLDGFNDLQLPSNHKQMVQSLVQTHFRTKKAEERIDFDLVRNKGKGLIILLHGTPGVGKTSTAECVAESTGKPLLPITCGDLGTKPQEVESKLERIFQLAQAWDCVLLLDEADVFLSQRTQTDLKRNALVSIFLRILEYYDGILFLTTNRVGSFDEAFKSRIHISLYYPPLTSFQTTLIWQMQLRRLKERRPMMVIQEDHIRAWAADHYEKQCQLTKTHGWGGAGWNGRQIRNAFQSAAALAEYNSSGGIVKLEVQHFELVAQAAREFDEYLIRVKGFNEAEDARRNRIRADHWDPTNSRSMAAGSLAKTQIPQQQANFGATTYSSFVQPTQQTAQQPFVNTQPPTFPQYSAFGSQQQQAAPQSFPASAQMPSNPQQNFWVASNQNMMMQPPSGVSYTTQQQASPSQQQAAMAQPQPLNHQQSMIGQPLMNQQQQQQVGQSMMSSMDSLQAPHLQNTPTQQGFPPQYQQQSTLGFTPQG